MTGMGKSGHIAKKIAATLASLGTPAFYLHPGEAMHGDLGMLSKEDIVIAISFSGESDEIIKIIPNIKLIGIRLIALTGNPKSTLAKIADIVQIFPKIEEACYLGLAPTSSTTATLCYGDSLAIVASRVYNFRNKDFAALHPAGSLGKRLIFKVENLMSTGEKNAKININSSLKDAIIELSKKGLGVVAIVDNTDNVLGIITDGDLRRQLERNIDIYTLKVEEIMHKKPIVINKNQLAIEALKIMKEKNISCLLVTEENKLIGIIRLQDIIGVGIIG